MRALLVTCVILACAVFCVHIAVSQVAVEREQLKRDEGLGLLFPSSIAKLAALEYRGLIADVIFSRAMTFFGSKLIREEALKDEEWQWIYKSMDAATDLDPYFLDPYYFGSINLTWGAGKIMEANALLEKANRFRTWDWTIPFHLGFNQFYFFRNNEKASQHLMEASRRPGASPMMVDLAVKLSHKVNRTEHAILFLENILQGTDDERLRKEYEKRLATLKNILQMENAVAAYRKAYGKAPLHVTDLVSRRILTRIPPDPYGGNYYLDKQGRIESTSNAMKLYVRD